MRQVSGCFFPFVALVLALSVTGSSGNAAAGTVYATERGDELVLTWTGDETIEVLVSKSGGLYRAPVRVMVNGQTLRFNGFYVHMNKREDGFRVVSTEAGLRDGRIHVAHVLKHPKLKKPTQLDFQLWMEPQDRGLRIEADVRGDSQHLDRLGLGDQSGTGLAAERMFFGRMYVLDKPQAFEHEHNYNTCKFWCWTMANGLTELQATGGPAKGFRYNPELGRYDLYTYCESPIKYIFWFTTKGPNTAVDEYRRTIDIPAPPTLSQLVGRVGVMTAYPIGERYEDFLEEWAGRGARNFVWLSYFPTPGDRQKVEPFGALYATYDIYLDNFAEGPRKAADWSPKRVQYRDNGKMVRGYWNSTWLLPELYVQAATTRVMGVFGREFSNDDDKQDFVSSPATRYSNLAITRAEVGPNAMYLDVHASKTPHHYFDWKGGHHGAWEHMRGEKALFDFVRDYLGNVPIWSEGGGEDYAGLMDGGWFMDYRPPEELGIHAAKWQYFPFIDWVHRERLLNMSIYYPPDHYDTNMVNLAVLFGRPQAVSVYAGTPQEDVSGRLKVYYMTQGFHQMLGLSRMERIDFQDDDINRCIVTYSNGAKVWSNRSGEEWAVEGYRLPPEGYLIKGPDSFLEYRAMKDDVIVDVVHCPGYDYYSAPKSVDFGPIICNGAVAVVSESPERVIFYEIQKPGGITFRLGEVCGTQAGQHALRAWAVLTRDRRVEITFPAFRQPPDPKDRKELGDTVSFSSVEMRNTLRYEVELAPAS
ncbi:MAG: hypothetical protein HY706_15440 [Candidatus Hydrogenedentes bacterium]|nr:hypothetical protein [Candidatus Hydrogenedentota bacterium]